MDLFDELYAVWFVGSHAKTQQQQQHLFPRILTQFLMIITTA